MLPNNISYFLLNNGEIQSQIPLSHCIVVTLYCVHTYTAHIPTIPTYDHHLPACLTRLFSAAQPGVVNFQHQRQASRHVIQF